MVAVCWGRNSHGQATPPAGETFATISSGGWHTCALRADGSGVVICWGGAGMKTDRSRRQRHLEIAVIRPPHPVNGRHVIIPTDQDMTFRSV